MANLSKQGERNMLSQVRKLHSSLGKVSGKGLGGVYGLAYESILRDYLRDTFHLGPGRVVTGLILSPGGKRVSRQMDILITKPGTKPAFLAESCAVVNARDVLAAIEVKGYSDQGNSFSSILSNLRTVRQIAPTAKTYAFLITVSSAKAMSKFQDRAKQARLDGIFGLWAIDKKGRDYLERRALSDHEGGFSQMVAELQELFHD